MILVLVVGANHSFGTMKWQFYQETLNTKRLSSKGPQRSSVSKKIELDYEIGVHLLNLLQILLKMECKNTQVNH